MNRLAILLFLLFTTNVLADPEFNRCKKFSTYPAPIVFNKAAVMPDRSHLPTSSANLFSVRLGFNPDAKADYSGQFKVLEIQEDPDYRYYFWDLKSGHIIDGPISAVPALWRLDSRLFIVPASGQKPQDFNHLGFIGNDRNDTATYYLLNDNQRDPAQTLLETLTCP